MQSAFITHDLVLLGGGHAHVEVLRRFGMRRQPGVRLTVISREVLTPYSGMLPGFVAGHYTFDEIHIDLAPLAHYAGARLYHDEVIGLDLERGLVHCRHRPPVDFDLLSIDTGSTPALGASGAALHAVPVKPVSNFTTRWAALRERARRATGPLKIGVVGGGAGGVELLLAARHCLLADRQEAAAPAHALDFLLLTAGPDILPSHAPRARRLYRDALRRSGVTVHLSCRVTGVEQGRVRTDAGQSIALDEILWVTEAAAPAWPREAGLATDPAGFIRVDTSLRSLSHPQVFAAGDIAAVEHHPRPKSGVFAVRQGPPLADNLRRALISQPLVPYRPQQHFLGLISTGGRHAIASRGAFACAGDWVWQWKDFIDRRFMRRYVELPSMAAAEPQTAAADASELMRCGGCGGKIGADILRAALAALPPATHADVVIGLSAPDDAAVVRIPANKLAVHTVDAFRSFIDDPWAFGRIAANHCLGDIYAMGAEPQTALALITLPLAAPAKMRVDLEQILLGARTVLDAAGAALVGGHTSEGAELTVGFAINGLVDEGAILRKQGARAGDVLILTRAIGSGVLLAAQMRGRAKATWLEPALTAMAASQRQAAYYLIANGATAMTDVTGFGLAGHLLEMLEGDTISAEVRLAQLPVLDGAAELSAAGLASSLYADNLHVRDRIAASAAAMTHAYFPLCFDPQTAGGLLASVPQARAAQCLAELHALGYAGSAIIGEVMEAVGGSPRLRLV